MSMQGFGLFVRLVNQGHTVEQVGLKAPAGEVMRWSARLKLARNFRGLQVDDCSERTLLGYGGFFRVFLTHSALERYLPIVGLTESELPAALMPHDPHTAIRQFFAGDRTGKLFNFLHARVKQKLRSNLTACRDGTCTDITCLSAAIRHIFAHGHLTANASDMNPNQVARACAGLSDFLLEFMGHDFGKRIGAYYHSLPKRAGLRAGAEEAQ